MYFPKFLPSTSENVAQIQQKLLRSHAAVTATFLNSDCRIQVLAIGRVGEDGR